MKSGTAIWRVSSLAAGGRTSTVKISKDAAVCKRCAAPRRRSNARPWRRRNSAAGGLVVGGLARRMSCACLSGENRREDMRGALGAKMDALKTCGASFSERPAAASYASVSSWRRLGLTSRRVRAHSSSLICTLSMRSSNEVQKGAVSSICMLTRVVQRPDALRNFSSNVLATLSNASRLLWTKVFRLPHSAEQRRSSPAHASDDTDSRSSRRA
eukprot:scaffold106786_cov63-Phaeocystis_antarctica.AAC.4